MIQSRKIRAFRSDSEAEWNNFVAASANGTFLFNRRFMEYHSDRFTDSSLIIYDDAEIIGLLPASISKDSVSSHAGLTYGGLLTGKSRASSESIYITLSEICGHFSSQGITSLVYKPVPHMYHRVPFEADLHAGFRLGAKLIRRDLSSALAPSTAIDLRKGRRALVQKAKKLANLRIIESDDWIVFHDLLKNRLVEKYGAMPVHSASELQLLHARFPDNIKLTTAQLNGAMIAGCVTFESDRVVHAQYLATNEAARETGAMDLLITRLIETVQAQGKWFDFGISTTNGGLDLNVALAKYKESFGAKSVVYDWYRIDF